MKDLGDVLDWIDQGNRTLFNPEMANAQLYVFENQYQSGQTQGFTQIRKSLPLDPLVFELFPDLYKKLVNFVSCKLTNNTSEIRLAFVLRRYSSKKNQRMRDRISAAL